jgi:hypothetical protein
MNKFVLKGVVCLSVVDRFNLDATGGFCDKVEGSELKLSEGAIDMKKFIIFILLLLVIAIGGLAFAVSRASDIVAEYKPELERMASEALGSTVTLGELSASVFPKASVIVSSAKVADPENPEKAITVDNVSLDLELLPLLSGNVVITSLRIIKPTIVMSLEEDGIYIDGFARPEATPSSSGSATPAKTTSETPAATPTLTNADAVTVDLRSFEISGASLTVNDMVAETVHTVDGLDLEASLQFAMNKVHLSAVKGAGVFRKTVDFSYTCDTIRYSFEDGTIGLDSLQPQIGDSYVVMTGDLNVSDDSKELQIVGDNVIMEDFREVFAIFAPAANDFGVAGKVEPNIKFALTPTGYRADGTVKVVDFAAGVPDVVTLNGLTGTLMVNATEAAQSVTTEGMNATMNGAPMTLTMRAGLNPETGKIEPLTINAFQGKGTFNTTLTLSDERIPFSAKVVTSGMLIEELVPAFAPDMPFAITGTFQTMNGTIRSTLDDDMLSGLVGESNVMFVDGTVMDVNLGKQVLGSITELPFIQGALLAYAPASFAEFVENPDTVLEEVSGSFMLKEETIFSNDMKIVSDFFAVDAKGTIGLDTNLDLDAIVRFNADFSAELADDVEGLFGLLDEDGRLVVPVKITGIPPELVTKPDMSGMLKSVMKQTVQNEAQKLLEDQLDEETSGVVNELLGGDDEEGGVGGLVKGLFGGKKKKE